MNTARIALNRHNEPTGLYCSLACLKFAENSIPVSVAELADEENDELWFDTDDGCRLPLLGHTCGECGELIFE
jgi:hypothetical protein